MHVATVVYRAWPIAVYQNMHLHKPSSQVPSGISVYSWKINRALIHVATNPNPQSPKFMKTEPV